MEVKKTGKYRLLSDHAFRGTISIACLSRGQFIEITQVDVQGRKVIGPETEDWQSWELPVEPVEVEKLK